MSKAYIGRNGDREFFIAKMKATVYFGSLTQLAEADCIYTEWYLQHYAKEASRNISNMHFTFYFNNCTNYFSK